MAVHRFAPNGIQSFQRGVSFLAVAERERDAD